MSSLERAEQNALNAAQERYEREDDAAVAHDEAVEKSYQEIMSGAGYLDNATQWYMVQSFDNYDDFCFANYDLVKAIQFGDASLINEAAIGLGDLLDTAARQYAEFLNPIKTQ